MKYLKRAWNYLLVEPFIWLTWCFFQPTNFKREFEIKKGSKRIVFMLRLALPIFLILVSPIIYLCSLLLGPQIDSFLITTVWTTILSISIGIMWGIVGDIATGIISGILFGICLSLIWRIGWGIGLVLEVSIAIGIVLNVTGSIIPSKVEHILGVIVMGTFLSIIGSMVIGIYAGIMGSIVGIAVGGIIWALAWGNLWFISGGIPLGILVGSLTGIAHCIRSVRSDKLGFSKRALWTFIEWSIAGGIAGGIVEGIGERIGVTGTASRIIIAQALTVQANIPPAAALSFIVGIALSAVGIIIGLFLVFLLGIEDDQVESVPWGIILWGAICSFILGGFAWIISKDIGIGVGLAFLGCLGYATGYNLNYYRIPLYLLSSLSMFLVYSDSKWNSSHVFSNLHNSWLYHDSSVFLPLPLVEDILMIAVAKDSVRALEEINFIATKRPSQVEAAQAGLREITIQTLRHQKTVRDIAGLSEVFPDLLSVCRRLANEGWLDCYIYINEAIQQAVSYHNLIRWQDRRDALKDMKKKLISASKTSPEGLNEIIRKWRDTVQHDLDKLEQEHHEADQIDNPYIPGAVLALGTTLFVGRTDLAQQLEKALEKGTHRPTFFLYGERRMGKSSTLRQLPILLSRRYLPIFFDLQNPGITSNIVRFLGAIAEGVYKGIDANGMQVENLNRESLQEASQQNEASPYFIFDEWLDKVEQILEQEDRTLLLTFDEFESLEKPGEAKYLDLELLLNWFRSVIQNRSRVALLFSGQHNLSDLSTGTGINWAGYFVNVQTLKVGFLQLTEAYQLITRPVPDFQGEQIFGKQIAYEIIRVAGCHPFLIQAVCSALIDNLNATNSHQAEIDDVVKAVKQVFDRWWDTYFRNLWDRTDQDQRTCLIAMNTLVKGSIQQIEQQSMLVTLSSPHAIRQALQELSKRDLVLVDNNDYYIAAPIFSEWVKRISGY